MNVFNQIAAHPIGALILLSFAAFLEVFGDSFFQAGLHHATGSARLCSFASGIAILAFYGFTVNVPRWDFGRLLGVYVALFFVVAQVVAKIRFDQTPTTPIYVGGTLILAGGGIIAFWK